MRKDPAFLFYPGDASEDTQFMNRLERGCYFDLLKAQKKFCKFNLDLIKKVLGSDFERCWPAIEVVLKKEGEFYFIEWVNESMVKRSQYSASRGRNRKGKNISNSYEDDMNNISNSCDAHMGNGNGIVNENTITDRKEVQEETENVPRGAKPLTEDWFNQKFDEVYLESQKMNFRKIDVDDQYEKFKIKVRGSPEEYQHRDTASIRLAFQYQLRTAKPIRKHDTGTNKADRLTTAKTFGTL